MSNSCLSGTLNKNCHCHLNRGDFCVFLVRCRTQLKVVLKTLQPTVRALLTSIILLFSVFGSLNAYAKHLLVFGDSLSAAYGMEWEQGWAQLIDQQWQSQGSEHQISNASISGETTAGGLARLPLTLEELMPDVVLIELGANDGLRGYPIDKIRQNLTQMVELSQVSGAVVLIGGISLPASYGPRYIDQFRQVFRDVAEDKDIAYIDFFIGGFLSKPGYIQSDGLHPTQITQALIKDAVFNFLAQQPAFNSNLD
ncbi:MAG: acyl-CoA thioesterase-1 [Arenicella sp.]|jgi:acyl-CoA thioesterase-1